MECSEQPKPETLSLRNVIDNIVETLRQADGEYIAEIHNRICSNQVSYLGDSIYELQEIN